jgi:uncharacterized protein YndB with AHSA1/START domain
VSATATVVAPAPPEETWARWSDLAAWPDWNPTCLAASLNGPLAPGTRLELRLRHPRGRDFWTRPTLTAVDPQRRLDWAARGLGLLATTSTRLNPEPDGTRVTVVTEASGRMAFTFRLTLTDGAQARMWTDALDALVASLRAR